MDNISGYIAPQKIDTLLYYSNYSNIRLKTR